MRAYIPSYNLTSPGTLNETLELLAEPDNGWKPFAGGTDLMVLLEAGKLPHKNYINIWQLQELHGIEATDEYVRLGALTTYTEVQRDPILQSEFPMLCQAARETGGIAIQNRGTLGGNIVNASPAADSPPALLAYEAELEFESKRGRRRVPYRKFHRGYKQMDIETDELLTAIYLPRNKRMLTHYYRKVGTRKAQAISKICFAGLADCVDGEIKLVRIALGSIAPIPLRCAHTETSLSGKHITGQTIESAKTALSAEISPITDVRSTKEYRRQVTLNLLENFLRLLNDSPR